MKEKDTQRFLFIADAHIKARTWNNTTVLQGDAYAALNKIAEDLPTDIETLVIGGDWFDSTRPSSMDVQKTVEFLARFNTVYCIAGNHDNTEPYWLESIYPVTILKPDNLVQLTDNAWLCGISWCSSADKLVNELSRMSSAVAELPKGSAVYCVLHNGLRELLGIEGTFEISEMQLENTCPGVSVRYLIGHVHTRKTFATADGLIHSPGSLYPVSTDKMLDDNAVSVISTDSGAITDMSVNVRNYSIVSPKTQAELDSAIYGCLKAEQRTLPPFVLAKVSQDSGISAPASRYPGACVQIKTLEEEAEQQQQATDTGDAGTMDDAVLQAAAYDKDIADMSLALLHSDDPLDSLFAWFGAWGVETTTGTKNSN